MLLRFSIGIRTNIRIRFKQIHTKVIHDTPIQSPNTIKFKEIDRSTFDKILFGENGLYDESVMRKILFGENKVAYKNNSSNVRIKPYEDDYIKYIDENTYELKRLTLQRFLFGQNDYPMSQNKLYEDEYIKYIGGNTYKLKRPSIYRLLTENRIGLCGSLAIICFFLFCFMILFSLLFLAPMPFFLLILICLL